MVPHHSDWGTSRAVRMIRDDSIETVHTLHSTPEHMFAVGCLVHNGSVFFAQGHVHLTRNWEEDGTPIPRGRYLSSPAVHNTRQRCSSTCVTCHAEFCARMHPQTFEARRGGHGQPRSAHSRPLHTQPLRPAQCYIVYAVPGLSLPQCAARRIHETNAHPRGTTTNLRMDTVFNVTYALGEQRTSLSLTDKTTDSMCSTDRSLLEIFLDPPCTNIFFMH